MGNSLSRKRKVASSPSKTDKKWGSDVMSLTSNSLKNMKVEFPKEIEDDLERRKVESLKAPAAGSRKTSTSASAISDPAHEMYEKVKKLDVPVVVLPKPWSEVDQMLSKLNPAINDPLTKKASPLPKPARNQQVEALAQLVETIDMWDLMDDLEEEDASPRKMFDKTDGSFTAKDVRPLESSLSFSTIHTVEEIEGSGGKPETVTSILKGRSYASLKNHGKTSSDSAVATTQRKVIKNVNPKLLARLEAFQ